MNDITKEVNNNYNHFSPNFSAGSMKSMSPFYNSINPTPNINTNAGFSNFFLFNNNVSGTPIKAGFSNLPNSLNNINLQMYGSNICNNNIVISKSVNTNNNLCNFAYDEENLKDKRVIDEPSSILSNSNQVNNKNFNLKINNVSNPTIKNIPIISNDEERLIGIQPSGKNQGFYSWVIHGSPVLHNNPETNYTNKTGETFIRKRKNPKKN